MTDWVACPACGTRIKAGRGHCLRCFEPLPEPGTLPRLSVWESLGWSRGAQAIAAAAASVAAIALLTVIWQTGGAEPVEDSAAATRPKAAPSAPPRAAAPAPVASKPSDADAPPEPVPAGSEGDEPFFDQPRARNDADHQRFQKTAELFRAGREAVDGGHWTRAIEQYGEAARLAPDDPSAQYNLALALHRRGDERDAIATFHKAIALAPDEPALHVPLAAAFEHVGQSADAVKEYRAFIAASPNGPEADRMRYRIEALLTGNPARGR